MNKVFIISDLHLGHSNIIKYENRPFNNVEEMDETIIQNWNNTVAKQDKVFILGDFALGGVEQIKSYVGRLNGYKILIKGNHDKSSVQWWQEAGINEFYSHSIIYDTNVILSHRPPDLKILEKDKYYKYIFGHIHKVKDPYELYTDRYCCICIENWDYKPIEYRHIKQLMNK